MTFGSGRKELYLTYETGASLFLPISNHPTVIMDQHSVSRIARQPVLDQKPRRSQHQANADHRSQDFEHPNHRT